MAAVRDLIVLEYNVLDVSPELSNKGLPQGILLDLLNRGFGGLRLFVCGLEEDLRWRLRGGLLGNFGVVALENLGRK